jgi:ketosteroid isomerase-like protein
MAVTTATPAATTADLAQSASRCLEALTAGDRETTRALLSDDVSFDGPMGRSEGVDAFVRGLGQMADVTESVQLHKTIVHGDEVCIMYDLVAGPVGVLPAVNWFHFRDGRIDAVRAYFDPRPLSAARPKASPEFPLFAAALQVCQEPD